uniref:Putative antiviral protein n=1 Tax=Lonomia obliqua TaxID=304329 RepID=I3PIK2_LONON|nr:putative antiviral protein [Lonomia obliqua]
MLKFIILSLLCAVAQAKENELIGSGHLIATFPRLQKHLVACSAFSLYKVKGVQCTCGDKTDVPLLVIKYQSPDKPQSSDSAQEFMASVMVKTYEEVKETVNIKTCKCGKDETEYEYSVYREINDNFGIIYSAPQSPNGPEIAFISVETLPTKTVFENTIKSIPELASRSDYELLCDLS